MNLSPLDIIFNQMCKYLNKDEEEKFIRKLSKLKRRDGRPFLNNLLKNFDIEVFKDQPLIPEDIWLYNYIKYEITPKSIPTKGLIAIYERKVIDGKAKNNFTPVHKRLMKLEADKLISKDPEYQKKLLQKNKNRLKE